ncbi:protein MKS1 [Impatiens glandulifera]|uniref:protein MKS1 n=1 Tax=Impatiens glandulifera TaxID=253017 RepID=UPI001FB16829|nr:protein MKS1 [Impatiens glandulifera]
MPFSLLFSAQTARNSPFPPLSKSDHCPLTILMNSPEFPTGKSPRRELQGPRPTPLKVRKDSHKIRKPPVAPAAQPPFQPAQPRQPVIIYTVSPKIIHADPSEFMNLVQRLTGASSSSSMVTAPSSFSQFHETGAISPAARFAATEKTKLSPEKQRGHHLMNEELGMFDQVLLERTPTGTLFPGILSPGPASLPPIPSKMFQSPAAAADPNPFNTMFNDFSPMLGNSSFMIPSPSNYFLSPKFSSPTTTTTPSMDIFNNFFDL